ncbi:MAG: DoxX family protein [Herpetosiphon sp.]
MHATTKQTYSGLIWLVARLWLGYEWLTAGIEKVFGAGNAAWVGNKAGVGVSGFLKGAIAHSPLAPGYDVAQNAHPAVQAWYAQLAQSIFLPNAQLFSYLVSYGELLVGIALIVGLFTHFAALMGVVMNLAYLLAGTTSTNPQLLVVGLVIVLAGGTAVSRFGLDRFARPFERKLVTQARARRIHALPAV